MIVEKYRLINIYQDNGMYFYVGSQFVTNDLQMIRKEIDIKWNNYKSI